MNDQTSAPEDLQARPQYELNFELVASRKREIQDQLNREGISRREVIEQETGRERLRDLVWNDPSELSLIERCQLVQDLLHELALIESVAP